MGMHDRDWYKDHHVPNKNKSKFQTLDRDPRELEKPSKPYRFSIFELLIAAVLIVIIFFQLRDLI